MSRIEVLGQLLAEGRRGRVAGSVSVLDFLPAPDLEGLRAPLQAALGPGWGVHLVGDPKRRPGWLSAGQAVDLREDLSRRSFFLVCRDEAGAGLQGVYDVAEVLVEREVLRRLRDRLRAEVRRLEPGLEPLAWRACREARAVLGGHLMEHSLSREIAFLEALLATPTEAEGGRQLWRLGLIPEERLGQSDLSENVRAVRELLAMEGVQYLSPQERVGRLKLVDKGLEAAVARVIGQAHSLDALEAWLPRLAEEGLLFGRWRRAEAGAEVERVELLPLTLSSQKPYRWTGLEWHAEHGLFFPLDEEVGPDHLEVRWKPVPAEVGAGQAEYRLQLLPAVGEEPLLQDLVSHRQVKGGVQRWRVRRERLAGVGQEATVRIAVAVAGREPETQVETEEFRLTSSLEPEVRGVQTAARVIRSRWDLMLDHVRAGHPLGAPEVSARGPLLELRLGRQSGTFEVPAALAAFQARILRRGQDPGAWAVTLRPDGSLADLPAEPDPADRRLACGKGWDLFLRARDKLFARFLTELKGDPSSAGEGLPLLVEALDLPAHADEIWTCARAYQNLLEGLAAELKADPSGPAAQGLDLALRVDTLTVRDPQGGALCRVIAPSHPLRLLWLLGYGSLLFHWAEQLAALKPAERRLAAPAEEVQRLTPHLFPAFAASRAEGLWVYADGVGLYWALMTPLSARDGQQRVAELLAAFKVKGERSAVAALSLERLKGRILDFLASRPYVKTLQVNALDPGDGSFLTRVFTEVRREHDLEAGLLPRLDLRLGTTQAGGRPGGHLDLLALARRKNQKLTDDEARLFRSTGDSVSPGLQWAHKEDPAEFRAAHLSILMDSFPGEADGVPEAPGAEAPEVYGLSLSTRLRVRLEGETLSWARWVEPTSGEPGQRHPARPSMTEWLASVHRALLRSAHLLAGGGRAGEPGLPAVNLSLDGARRRLLDELHRQSEWVLILDRYLGSECFDRPSEPLAEVYSRFLMDDSAGLLDGTSQRLMVSTSQVEEILGFLRRSLVHLGVRAEEATLRRLLFHVRALSGRVLFELGGVRSSVLDAVALAAFHRHQLERGGLGEALLFPLEALLPSGPGPGAGASLLVRVGWIRHRRRELLELEVIAVTLALDPIQALHEPLRQELLGLASRALEALREEYGLGGQGGGEGGEPPARTLPLTLPIRRRRLGQALKAALEKAARYGFMTAEAVPDIARRVDQLVDPKFDRVGALRAAGVVVAPTFLPAPEVEFEQAQGKVTVLGAPSWPELFGAAPPASSGPAEEGPIPAFTGGDVRG